MEAYDEYLKLMDSFNLNTIILIAVFTIILMVIISIIKYKMNVRMIRKIVKKTIKELALEEKNKHDKEKENYEAIQK